MLAADQIEELICVLSGWDRDTIGLQFSMFQSSFPIDFTPDFLQQEPLEKLRHVFLAMCLQNSRVPENAAMASCA